MGAALTYARRYALFTLVGIAGEDDLDAPDALIGSIEADQVLPLSPATKAARTAAPRAPVLSDPLSGQLREQLLAEIGILRDEEELALWAHRRLAAKNTLVANDARVLETAYQTLVTSIRSSEALIGVSQAGGGAQDPQTGVDVVDLKTNRSSEVEASYTFPLAKSTRRRNKAHLVFVADQPCVICQRTPCDAHHLKFAQPAALGRKVSDEFTVPLCRQHHHELHRHGNEMAWWANVQVAPLAIALTLWQTSPVQREPA
jgi:hypothetical protein